MLKSTGGKFDNNSSFNEVNPAPDLLLLSDEEVRAMNATRLNRSNVKPGIAFRSVTGVVITVTVMLVLWIIGVAGAFLRWW